jgi:hypothetical protein
MEDSSLSVAGRLTQALVSQLVKKNYVMHVLPLSLSLFQSRMVIDAQYEGKDYRRGRGSTTTWCSR